MADEFALLLPKVSRVVSLSSFRFNYVLTVISTALTVAFCLRSIRTPTRTIGSIPVEAHRHLVLPQRLKMQVVFIRDQHRLRPGAARQHDGCLLIDHLVEKGPKVALQFGDTDDLLHGVASGTHIEIHTAR
jgi:hypothetical protein